MKNIAAIVAVLAVALLALTVFDLDTALLGQDILSGSDLPWRSPDVDPNSVADSARGGADAAADQVESWSPEVWRMIVIGLLALGIVFMWFRSPKFKYAVIGGGIAVALIVAFV